MTANRQVAASVEPAFARCMLPRPHATRAQRLASLATQALIEEAEVTPKPALVDRRGNGAHHDLSLELMRRSALVLEPYFQEMAVLASRHTVGTALREMLGDVGRRAEAAMLDATGGVNTHRGAIWALGLLVSAAARPCADEHDLCMAAATMAAMPDRAVIPGATHGIQALRRYGAAGARGEAAAGFPHVLAYGLPTLRVARAGGATEQQARADALLSIMTSLDDTCLLHRGGEQALAMAKEGARAVLQAGGLQTGPGRLRFASLESALLHRWASPGGAADMLAATLFVDALFPRRTEKGNR